MCSENDAIEDLLLALLNHSILIDSLRETKQEANESPNSQELKVEELEVEEDALRESSM